MVLIREESVGYESDGVRFVSFCEDLVGIEVVVFGVGIDEACNVVNIAA